jgi:hypothetical protein
MFAIIEANIGQRYCLAASLTKSQHVLYGYSDGFTTITVRLNANLKTANNQQK